MKINSLNFKRINPLISLFILTFSLRALVLVLSIVINGYDNFINNKILTPANDPLTYHQLAINLLNHNSFTYQAGLPPVSLRTPAYPLTIALVYFIFGIKPIFVILFQIFLEILTVLLIYKISINIFDKTIAFTTAILYAIDTHTTFYSLTMYSDTLFIFMIVLFFYFVLFSLRTEKITSIIFAAFFLGIAKLVKPLAVFVPLIVIIIYSISFKDDLLKILKITGIFSLTFLITIAPWLIRNYYHFGDVFLSTSGAYNLLVLNITPLKMNFTNKTQDETIFLLLSEADSLMKSDGVKAMLNKEPSNYWEELTLQYDYNRSKYWKKLAFVYLKNYPFEFTKFYLLGVLHSIVNLGTSNYAVYFNLTQNREGINLKFEKNLISLITKFFKKKTLAELIIGFYIAVYLFTVYLGVIIGFSQKNLFQVKGIKYLIILITIYFILISGAGGLARFRLPAIPFYLIFSAVGINYLINLIVVYLIKFKRF